MRKLTVIRIPGIGPGLLAPVTGSVADLVMAIPYLIHDEIPPRRVLNDVLSRGISDAGMSGGVIWEPFELDSDGYDELLAELQCRGTRPVAGRDPGGQPFEVSDVPDSVTTYGDWQIYRHQTPQPIRQAILDADRQPADDRYQHWLSSLPVGDLYISQLAARHPDWQAQTDDSLRLPAEFVRLLRDLERCHRSWYGHTRADLPRMRSDREKVDLAVDEFVARSGLPRWPFGPTQHPG